eukprot:c13627_g1_i2.p1 GENE.c13627_g1_i2~~c13627_g1_i2.p1  ORF type:complete len:372 (-),score=76.15 c13627_g1_i2:51-1166(-)
MPRLLSKMTVIANDHECLFNAIGYLVEGSCGKSTARRLRAVCADDVRNSPDRWPEFVLGMSNESYAQWIVNPLNWGGENEIVILSEHFSVEICVVSMQSGSLLVYGEGGATKGKIYLLFTGQHYDALVGGENENEIRVFPVGDKSNDEAALKRAAVAQQEALQRQNERRRKGLKCGGCGKVLDNSEAFQTHCEEFEHDDDFMYDCEEVEIVESIDDPLPGGLDVSAMDTHMLYNTPNESLSIWYPADINMNGKVYPTIAHAWLAHKFISEDDHEAVRTSSIDETRNIAFTDEGAHADWETTGKYNALLAANRAKFSQHPKLRDNLLATAGKALFLVDQDPWLGVTCVDRFVTGKNFGGSALEAVREELLPK